MPICLKKQKAFWRWKGVVFCDSVSFFAVKVCDVADVNAVAGAEEGGGSSSHTLKRRSFWFTGGSNRIEIRLPK